MNPLTPGITARKLTWMHEGRTESGEVVHALNAMFGDEPSQTTNDPRILFPH